MSTFSMGLSELRAGSAQRALLCLRVPEAAGRAHGAARARIGLEIKPLFWIWRCILKMFNAI